MDKVLIHTTNKAHFCSTINNENPLSLSVTMNHKSCIEVCLKYMRLEYAAKNSRAYMPFSNCLTEFTLLDVPAIPRIYDILYQQNSGLHLPSFCGDGATTPVLTRSTDIIIALDELLPAEFRSTHGESIVFYGSLCPISMELGTEASIAFLESLLECKYDEIFRTRIIDVFLRDR